MRIALVDDLKTERALLKERLSQQLALRGVEADIWNLKAARLFSRQKKSGAFRLRFSTFTWRA